MTSSAMGSMSPPGWRGWPNPVGFASAALCVMAAQIDAPGPERERASLRHGVSRIRDEIQDRQAQLFRIDQCRASFVAQLKVYVDILAYALVYQSLRAPHRGVHLHRFGIQRLFATKG